MERTGRQGEKINVVKIHHEEGLLSKLKISVSDGKKDSVLYFTHCDRPLYYFFILEYSETQ
jgi:hypothetical protein